MTRPKAAAKRTRTKLNADIRVALRNLYGPPDSVIFFEVAAGTGYDGQRRRADAVAMGLWPSRGMKVTCIEIKVDRSDWLRERKNPEKAEEIAAYCDLFMLVTVPGVVTSGTEVPHAWRWWELIEETGALKLRQAGFDTDAKPLDRGFVASLLRSAGKVDDATIDAEVERRMKPRLEGINKTVYELVKIKSLHMDELISKHRAMDAIIQEHNGYVSEEVLLRAVRLVLKSGVLSEWSGLKTLSDRLTQMAGTINKALAEAKDEGHE